MCPFNIEFLAETDDDGEPIGRITIGDFNELFSTSFHYWAKEQYYAQWKQAISDIVSKKADRGCLFICMSRPPEDAKFFNCWPIYRVKNRAIFQNQLLFMDQVGDIFDVDNPGCAIGDRQPHTDDRRKVSEWSIPISDLIEWLKTSKV